MEENNEEQKSVKLIQKERKRKWINEKVNFVVFSIQVLYIFWYIYTEGSGMYKIRPQHARFQSPLWEEVQVRK